ncbi:FKBP-type peptidyl-prolyl cis-trans isomerase [Solirubrobacter taibaiensis]|nr:FKBP-type peptidyl-prolyl cis-trans isomerase [Solirubrobacter taibaiensis]
MLATLAAASALLLAPIPPVKAFDLPTVKECVGARTLTFSLRPLPRDAQWTRATVTVDGKRVKRINKPRPTRDIRVRSLPLTTFELAISARTSDGRTATVKRTYHPCPQGAKPTITIPDGPPPTTLVTRDLLVGTGATARAGKDAKVHYVLVTYSNRKEIDSTWGTGEPFEFSLGQGFVIKGFDEGIAGMRVGGRREIVMPPEFGYGEAGVPPEIRENETLVFVVDLVAVSS